MTRIPPLNTLLGETVRPETAPRQPETAAAPAPKMAPDQVQAGATPPAAGDVPAVQARFAAAPLEPAELRRLLNGPATLPKIAALLERQPELRQNLLAAGGERVLELLGAAARRSLSPGEVCEIQRFLVDKTQARIGYRGHPDGIDGHYGKLTHAALVNSLTRAPAAPAQQPAAPQPAQPAAEAPPTAAAPPAADMPVILARLRQSGQNLQQLAAGLQTLPAAERAKLASLSQNGVSLADLLGAAASRPLSQPERLSLQSLLVQAGENLAYAGHPTGIDGQIGPRSLQALQRVATRLLTGQPAPAAQGPVTPRYDKMFADHLLDMTLAVGFDEGTYEYAGANVVEDQKLIQSLEARGFVRNDARARELLTAAGKAADGDYTALYVKENVDQADGQPVHAVVRVITSGDGSHGAASRKAAIEGMSQSDVFAYGGHGRYGNGPDFDRNFTVTIDWTGVAGAPTQGKVTYQDYEQLKDLLGNGDAEAISKLKSLEKAGKVTIQAYNDGNIRMNEKPLHSAEFGAGLTHRALEQKPNTLAEEIHGDQYKLWLFEACRTRDFVDPIRHQARSNSALDAEHLDLIATEQVMYWQNTGASMLALLDGVMAKDSAAGLTERLKAVNPEQAVQGRTHGLYGFEDNPRALPR